MSIPYIVHYFRPLYDDMILLEGAMYLLMKQKICCSSPLCTVALLLLHATTVTHIVSCLKCTHPQ
jgi:hypothetical protein